MVDSEGKVRLVVDGVNASDRHLLNRMAELNGGTRGEVLSKILRQAAERTYGVECVADMVKRFESRQQARRNDDVEPKSFDM